MTVRFLQRWGDYDPNEVGSFDPRMEAALITAGIAVGISTTDGRVFGNLDTHAAEHAAMGMVRVWPPGTAVGDMAEGDLVVVVA